MSLEVDETCPGDVPMKWRVTDDAIHRALHAESDKVTLDVLHDLMRDEWKWGEHERRRETEELRRALKAQGIYAGGVPPTRPFGYKSIVSSARTPAGTQELMWETGGGPSGATEVGNDDINADPALRVFQRCDSIEQLPGVECRDGRRVVLDEGERKVMAGSGRLQTWMARWVVASLHVAHHLTDVAAYYEWYDWRSGAGEMGYNNVGDVCHTTLLTYCSTTTGAHGDKTVPGDERLQERTGADRESVAARAGRGGAE
jgi:hypothetical protein